jgi:phage terminase large subunit-like protein
VQELKESYIKPQGISLSIDEFRPNRTQGDKEERIMSILQPKFDNMQVWFYKGGNCQILEEELTLAHPPHDDVEDALANAIAIASSPRRTQNSMNAHNVIYSSRFGGVAFA